MYNLILVVVVFVFLIGLVILAHYYKKRQANKEVSEIIKDMIDKEKNKSKKKH